jgi:hypothetical protein
MKLRTRNHNYQYDDPDDGFPAPSDAVPGLIPGPQEVSLPEGEVALIVAEPEPAPVPAPENSRLDVLLQLGLGAVLLGINATSKRLQEKQTQVVISSPEAEPLSHLDDDQDQLKYALIGMILRTPRVIKRGTARAAQLANTGYRRVSGLFDPLTGSRALRPVNSRLDQVVARGERIVNDWIDTGRRGEKTSQVLLQQTTDEVVGEVVDMLASRPEIRELVQQQSMGMVDELTDELQGRAAAVDTLLERIVYLLIPGSKKDTTPTLIIPLREDGEPVKAKKQPPKGGA